MRAAYLLSPSFITRGRMGASKAALILMKNSHFDRTLQYELFTILITNPCRPIWMWRSLKFVFLFRLWRPTFRRCWKYGLSIEPPLSAAFVLQVHLSQGSDSGRKNHRDLQTTKGKSRMIKNEPILCWKNCRDSGSRSRNGVSFFAKAVVQSSILHCRVVAFLYTF